MNYTEMNDITYEYYQYPPEKGRNKLFDMNKKTTGFEDKYCYALCQSDCYKITAAETVYFSGLTEMSLQEIYQYFNDNLFFTWDNDKYKHQPGNYQQTGTKDIYKQMEKDGLIESDYTFIDCDYGHWEGSKKVYSDAEREQAYNELTRAMSEDDFISARVCVDNGSSHGHAMMVTKKEGLFVVIDNSKRPHTFPQNRFVNFITKLNIKWWTMIQ